MKIFNCLINFLYREKAQEAVIGKVFCLSVCLFVNLCCAADALQELGSVVCLLSAVSISDADFFYKTEANNT